MASQEEINQLLGKALSEPEFRAQLSEDPVKAAAGIGISLTEEEVAALKASDLSAMEGLDERLSKSMLALKCPKFCSRFYPILPPLV